MSPGIRPKINVCLKKLAESRHIVPGQQAQGKREDIAVGVPGSNPSNESAPVVKA